MLRRLLTAFVLFAVLGGVASAAERAPPGPVGVEAPPENYRPLARDSDLLDALDSDRPELRRIEELYRAGSADAALAQLATYFRSRVRPVPQDPPEAQDIAEADAIRAGRIGSGAGLPPFTVRLPHDWEADPYGDVESVVALSRHGFLTPLAAAFRATGDEEYLKKAAAYVDDWFQHAREAHYLRGEPIRVAGRERLWMPRAFWLNAAERLRAPWLNLLFAGRQSAALSDRMLLRLLRMMHNQTDYILATMLPGDDRAAIAGGTLEAIGLLFPEFRRSSVWRRAGAAALREVAERQFAPDGAHIGMAPHYALVTLRSLARPQLLAARNGHPTDPRILAALTRGLDYLVGISDPARDLPALKLSDRTALPPLLLPLLALFPDRSDLAFVATDGRHGSPPAVRSRAFAHAGQAAFRSGWDGDAVYLLFDAGPMGTLPHEDKLGLILHAYGAALLADPGRHSYNRRTIDDYLWSSHAHSVVLVDGQGQSRASCPSSTWSPDRPAGITFRQQRDGEMAAARFTGPWKSGAQVVHRREVRFIEERLFLIVDRLQPEDDRDHSYDGRFQLAEGTAEIADRNVVFRAENSRAGLVVARLSMPAATPLPTIVTGSENPPGGWIAPSYGRLVPAPSIRYAAAPVAGPAMFVTALVPYRGTTAPAVVLDWAPGGHGTHISLRVRVNSLETNIMVPLSDDAATSSNPHAGREPPCIP